MTLDDLVARLNQRINLPLLAECKAKFAGLLWEKFFDTDRFLPIQAAHALRLSELIPPGSKCLDVGAGFGYCALALQELGHDVTALEKVYPAINEIAKAVPVADWVFKTLKRQEPLAIAGGPYSLILAHGVIPIRDTEGSWGWPEYGFLGADLMRSLAPGGVLEWIVNRGDEGVCALDQASWDRIAPDGCNVVVSDNVVHARRRLSA